MKRALPVKEGRLKVVEERVWVMRESGPLLAVQPVCERAHLYKKKANQLTRTRITNNTCYLSLSSAYFNPLLDIGLYRPDIYRTFESVPDIN